MPRFFVQSENIADSEIKITGDDARHIARALRMAVGDKITVCDMHGGEHLCLLEKIRDEVCLCRILSSAPGKTEPPVKIRVYMAYPKSDKLETVIQKATELGASAIIPFESSRCIKRPDPDKAEKQNSRLCRIATEAAKQCGRSIIPQVLLPITFEEMLEKANASDLPLFCYEGDGTRSLKEVLMEAQDVKTVSVVVGSEGGFSISEAQRAIESGLIPVNLGPRILRCETAPLYTLAAISYRFEL